MKKIIWLLFLVYFLKELLWLAFIPIWHFPDEEQHFAQTAFGQEKGRMPQGKENDVNKEIDLSSEILGTKRDNQGINKYTYHPEYRLSYTDSQIGLYEAQIQAFNKQETRQTMVKQEAARYGPVYYFLTGIGYKIFFEKDLITRVFAGRIISVLLSILTLITTYFIAREIFKDELPRIALTFLVGFTPMFSFVSAGVNSDNLFNLIFTLILYSCLKIFFNSLNKARLFLESRAFTVFILIVSLIIGFYTKRQIFIALPIILFAFCLSVLIKEGKNKKNNFFILGLVGLIFLFITKGKIRIPEYNSGGPILLAENFFQYIYWHLRHTVTETIPWYWGVFNWLGVTLPRWVLRVQARILIVAVLGFLIHFFKKIKAKNILAISNLKIFFLLGSGLIYYCSIICWDYFFRQGHSFSFGLQGRYFFPTIVSHMLFIILGIALILPRNFGKIVLKTIIFWWFIFSLIGLSTAVQAYYQLWPLNTFLNEASQYKPIVFKSTGLILIALGFFVSSNILMIKLILFHETKNK